MADKPKKPPGNPMKYPYTFAAQIAQFPYKIYFKNHWQYRYFIYGTIASLPIIYKIHKAANSPENVRDLEERRARERAAAHAH